MTIKIFVGTSLKEDIQAEKVLEYSLKKNCSEDIEIVFMRNDTDSNNFFGGFNSTGWATPFTNLRWAIPEYCGFEGRAIYMDVDMVNLRDISDLFYADLEGHPLMCREGWRTCVTLFDCRKMKQHLPSVDIIKSDSAFNKKHAKMLSSLGKSLDPRWNCLDGENRPINDIWHLHFTNMPTQPWKPAWCSFEFEEHPRKDLVALWETLLVEAEAKTTSFATDTYKRLLEIEHETSDWGVMAERMIETIRPIIEKYPVTTILDYGAGQGGFKRALNDPSKDVREYDIGIPKISVTPSPADFVVCIDVLEHVEPEYIDAVLKDLARVTKLAGYFNISTVPASRTLSDGRNAHVTIQPFSWWVEKVLKEFNIVSACSTSSSANFEVIPK